MTGFESNRIECEQFTNDQKLTKKRNPLPERVSKHGRLGRTNFEPFPNGSKAPSDHNFLKSNPL
jgi:hypothetical protein